MPPNNTLGSTGERELVFRQALRQNAFVFQGRPDLETLIPSIIQAANHGVLPDPSDHNVLHVENHGEAALVGHMCDDGGNVVLDTENTIFMRYRSSAALPMNYLVQPSDDLR
jgi:hypothetical protein